VQKLALSQESRPNTHHSVRETVRDTGIRQSSVIRIIHNDRLKCLKKRRAQELTESTATRQNAAEDVSGRPGDFYVVYY